MNVPTETLISDIMRKHIRDYQRQLVDSEKHAERCSGAIQALENLFKSLQEEITAQEAEYADQSDGSQSQAEANKKADTPAAAE